MATVQQLEAELARVKAELARAQEGPKTAAEALAALCKNVRGSNFASDAEVIETYHSRLMAEVRALIIEVLDASKE